ncbi:MAG: right-handed parallel beta-helix repeat-containing protein [Xanthobacteraceae bacterium]|nr:right-handed parallel beta-helix repeat-containing protein [Xanthobacteraceae bacterium]
MHLPGKLLFSCVLLAAAPRLACAQQPLDELVQVAIGSEKPGVVKNAAEAGIMCDGSTDVAEPISALTRDAGRDGARAIIYLPPYPAPCMLSHPIMLASNTVLLAAPGTVTLKPFSDSRGDPLVLAVGPAHDVLIYGIDIDGTLRDHITIKNPTRVVLIYQSSGVILDHLSIKHTRGIAVEWSTGITNSGVRNSVFDDIGNYWQLTHSRTDRAQTLNWDCGAENLPRHRDLFIIGNHISNTGYDPIATCRADRVEIRDNDLAIRSTQYRDIVSPDYPGGIYFVKASQGIIRGNSINGAAGACIDVADSQQLVIEKNLGQNCGASGAAIAASSDVVVRDNVFIDNAQSATPGKRMMLQQGAVTLLGPISNIKLSGNTLKDNRQQATQTWGVEAFFNRGPITDVEMGSNIIAGNARGSIDTRLRCEPKAGVEVCRTSP